MSRPLRWGEAGRTDLADGRADEREGRAPRGGLVPIRRAFRESFTDRTFMVAAGLAFFGMFSLFPAIAVTGLLFQALVDPDALETEVLEEAGFFPDETPVLLVEFLTVVPPTLFAGLGLSLNLVVVLYTVQRAASGMITALNIVYETDERRGRLGREAVALSIAGGAMVLLLVSLFLLVLLPLVVRLGGLPALEGLVPLRWPVLIALFFGAFALLYRFGGCRDVVDWQAILTGAAFTTAVWTVASVLFTLYINRAGDWEPYYGSVTAPIVLMTWMFISAFVVMIGAELDAQIEAVRHPKSGAGASKAALDRREGR
jgi:membrane protein